MPIAFPEPPGGLPRQPSGTTTEGALPAQPVYTVALEDLEAVGVAEDSTRSEPSWRYTRFDAAGRAEVFELRATDTTTPVSAGDDRFGPMIRDALAVAAEDERVARSDYEARLFRIPALTLLALWLHSKTEVDLFVLVGVPPPGLERNSVYEDPDFTAAITSSAAEMRETYEAADNTDELGG